MEILKEALSCAAALFLLLVLCATMSLGLNSCTEEAWNDGNCPVCEIRYELKGVSRGTKYYACPTCGSEVIRS